jgi:hypothetical protein
MEGTLGAEGLGYLIVPAVGMLGPQELVVRGYSLLVQRVQAARCHLCSPHPDRSVRFFANKHSPVTPYLRI